MRRESIAFGAALVVVLRASAASGHDRGYSTSELELAADGAVQATFSFSASELEKTSESDFLTRGVELRADDAPCPGHVDRYAPTGSDGMDVRVSFQCPPQARAYAFTLFLLSDLDPNHRNVARMSHGSATSQAILTPKARELRLEFAPSPAASPEPHMSATRFWWVLPLVAIGVALLLRSRRGRTADR